MANIQWKIFTCSGYIFNWFWLTYDIMKLTIFSLFYNDFADRYYIGDALIDPVFWFVDHFTKVLGPVCVTAVIVLTSSIIIIAYVIGLPFYLRQNSYILAIALLIGHWILLNVVFYYYMAFTTGPGYPPQGAMIVEAVSICKRCIAPKPPRTHHCIVCNRCILKMDHHCPWLNNCIGHFNHRYFFMFCTYAWIGVVFLIIFGIPVAYNHFFGDSTQSRFSPAIVSYIQFIGKFTFSSYHIQHNIQQHILSVNSTDVISRWPETAYHSCIVYAALLCVAVLFVLGWLLLYHARLISNGETSIEVHINKTERARLLKEGQVYKNPYNSGPKKNWKIFLLIGNCRPWWHILLPFAEDPIGNGTQWNLLSNGEWEFENSRKDASKTLSIKLS